MAPPADQPPQPPTVIIQMQPNGMPVIRSNLTDPLTTAICLGMASAEWAKIMGQMREAQASKSIVGPDGMPAMVPGG